MVVIFRNIIDHFDAKKICDNKTFIQNPASRMCNLKQYRRMMIPGLEDKGTRKSCVQLFCPWSLHLLIRKQKNVKK